MFGIVFVFSILLFCTGLSAYFFVEGSYIAAAIQAVLAVVNLVNLFRLSN